MRLGIKIWFLNLVFFVFSYYKNKIRGFLKDLGVKYCVKVKMFFMLFMVKGFGYSLFFFFVFFGVSGGSR